MSLKVKTSLATASDGRGLQNATIVMVVFTRALSSLPMKKSRGRMSSPEAWGSEWIQHKASLVI